jgi:outer membrane immunogenic protein
MKRFVRIGSGLAATTLLAFAATVATADGVSDRVRGTPEAEPSGWAGFYVGGHAGRAWGDANWTFRDLTIFNHAVGDKFSHALDGAFAGGQFGFNKQVGRWVWGLEGTLSGSAIEKTSQSPFFKADVLTTDIQLLWTATARLGYTWDRWLAYARAGYAGGRVETGALITMNGISAGETRNHNGWTVGLGIEYLLTRNLALGVEYGYIDLGEAEYHTPPLATRFDLDNDVTAHSVMARLNYNFGQ